ncbi:NAD(P)-binding protein [Irpex rosettiformis]|uniref:NAD(P)-binding protein n=1 Tax=Irpex rosettiformis TaxID=378272 RepID=A0ACB8U3X5_9APHY|nr:NAD(P)-binding protein [Irpex rosettiformis]
MTAVQSGKLLVSGANGYIAVWLLQRLLEQGFFVRGTVRSEKSLPYLKKLFSKYGDKLEFVIVADITKDGAFDEAVKGMDAVLHTASPFHYQASDPKEIIDPAVLGTVSILESVRQHAPQVKRVIILSSIAAIMDGATSTGPAHLSEKDWNVASVTACETLGKEAHQGDKYLASKTLAERAAWEFVDKHKGELKFDVVAINPPFVHGPTLHEVNSPENLNASLFSLWTAVFTDKKSKEDLTAPGGVWVDVRDLADGIIASLKKEEAGGQRIIVSADEYTWEQWVRAAHNIDNSIPDRMPEYDVDNVVHPITFDNTKSKELLGQTYIDRETCTRDMLAQFKEKGWY